MQLRSPGVDVDYYRLLNVSHTASRAEITRAYRLAIKRAHPDRALPELRSQQEEITRELNHAYAVLNNPTRRNAYDQSIRSQAVQEQIMNRYVAGMSVPTGDPFAQQLKRTITDQERREMRRQDRSAMWSVVSAFLVLLIGGLGLLAVFAVVSWVVSIVL